MRKRLGKQGPSKPNIKHNWHALASPSKTTSARSTLRPRALTKARVKYFNSQGSLRGGHEIALTDAKGRTRVVTARHIDRHRRPSYVPADFEGATEHAIVGRPLRSGRPARRSSSAAGTWRSSARASWRRSATTRPSSSAPSPPRRLRVRRLVLNSVGAAGAGHHPARGVAVVGQASSGRLLVGWRRTVDDDGRLARAAAAV